MRKEWEEENVQIWFRKCLLKEGVREKLLCLISRVDAECLEWSNMKIQNAISILLNTIKNNPIQKLETHNKFHGATITSSVSKKLQSPAIVTLTLYGVLISIKQFTQALLTMRVTIEKKSAASQWNGVDRVRIDWRRMNEKSNKKLLCPLLEYQYFYCTTGLHSTYTNVDTNLIKAATMKPWCSRQQQQKQHNGSSWKLTSILNQITVLHCQ